MDIGSQQPGCPRASAFSIACIMSDHVHMDGTQGLGGMPPGMTSTHGYGNPHHASPHSASTAPGCLYDWNSQPNNYGQGLKGMEGMYSLLFQYQIK